MKEGLRTRHILFRIRNYLEELLAAANGISISALPTRATLFRSNYGVENSALSIDLTNSSVLSIALKNGDRLFVPSVEVTDYGQIEVQGGQ